MVYIILGILGLIFGSFYLVVATRLPEGKSIIKPSSHCDNCKHALSWYELIPVVSYLVQKGKCRKCGVKIPIITILVEIITALSFMTAYYLYGFDYKFYVAIIIFSLTIIIFISDFKYYVISDSPLFISIMLVLILKYCFFGYKATIFAIIAGFIMFLVLLSIKFIGDKAFKKESLGGGDIKLAILLGVVLGIKLGLTAFIVSSFIAFPYAIVETIIRKENIVPFGPFIISALIIVFVFMEQFNEIINNYFIII